MKLIKKITQMRLFLPIFSMLLVMAVGPLLRWKQGTTVTLRVRNELPRGSIHGPDTSIHWHGILLPANMDGVPGMSFDGIRPGERLNAHSGRRWLKCSRSGAWRRTIAGL